MRKLKSSYALIITALFFILVVVFLINYISAITGVNFVGGNEMLNYVGSTMVNDYYVILEVMGILLFGSLIGAFYISGKEEQ